MAEILKDLSKKGKQNLQDLPKDEPKYLTPESGSNSFAKNVKSAIQGLRKDFNNYSKAKNRDKAKVKG